jgi:hypothetical protein
MKRSDGQMTTETTPPRASPAEAAVRVGAPSIDNIGEVDIKEARRFLGVLDPDESTFIFAAGDDDKVRVKKLQAEAKTTGQAPPIVFEQRSGDLSNAKSWIDARQKKGWGIFVTVQAMIGSRRRKDDVQHIRAVFHEWDRAASPPTFHLPPSIVVETSLVTNADGEVFPKRHSYWLVDPERAITAEDFHGIMECLVETHGSDPDAKDLARVLRLPGTWHLKGVPHKVRVVECTGARYSRDELIKAFPPPPRHKPDANAPRPKFNGRAPPGLERFHEPLKSLPADKYGIAILVGQALAHEGNGSTEALRMWDAWCATSATKWALGWCDEKWKSFNGKGVTGGTIFALAKEHGYVHAERKAKTPRPKKPTNGDGQNGQAHTNTNGANKTETPPHGDSTKPPEAAAEADGKNGQAHTNVADALLSFDPPHKQPIEWPEITPKLGSPVSKSQANIRAFLRSIECKIAYNAFTSDICITIGGITGELNDARRCRLSMAMHRVGFNPSTDFLGLALQDLALENSYHPVRDYLLSLQWDGAPRLDRWLVTYLGAADTELNRAFGSKHLLAGIKRIFDPGCKKDEVLVIEGETGIGKSSAIDILAGPYFTDALKIGQDSKEVIELTRGSWLVEFAELEGMRQREMATLKATLSRRIDTARLAYGISAESRPRQWLPFGTCNRNDYLRDPSGNRRFWPVRATRLDREALTRDRDQIWAEAVHRFQRGESIDLPKGLWLEAGAAQSERMSSSPWKMLLETALEGRTGRIAIADIFTFLGLADKSRQDPKAGSEIADIMTQLEWIKSRQRGYGGKPESREHCYCKGEDATWFTIR